MEDSSESYKDVTDVFNTCHAAGISHKSIKLRPNWDYQRIKTNLKTKRIYIIRSSYKYDQIRANQGKFLIILDI